MAQGRIQVQEHPLSTVAKKESVFKSILKNWQLYVIILPGILYFLIFKYLPMWGVVIAFKDYSPFLGFWKSPWVGTKNFMQLFNDPNFWQLFRNTILISLYNIVFFFPMPIIFALLLNEVRIKIFRRSVQTVIYLPHFVSWVVVASMTFMLLGDGSIVDTAFKALTGHSENILTNPHTFRALIVSQDVWKEAGWGTIIFFAALTGVDPQLYEAAVVDGANRWKQTWHITLPAIRSTILILLLLRIGTVLDVGFEQIFLMLNGLVQNVGNVFDTYVYQQGIVGGQFSYTTAVGLFKSVINLIIVVCANYLVKYFGEEGIF